MRELNLLFSLKCKKITFYTEMTLKFDLRIFSLVNKDTQNNICQDLISNVICLTPPPRYFQFRKLIFLFYFPHFLADPWHLLWDLNLRARQWCLQCSNWNITNWQPLVRILDIPRLDGLAEVFTTTILICMQAILMLRPQIGTNSNMDRVFKTRVSGFVAAFE